MTNKNPLAWNPSNGEPFAGTHRQRAGYAIRKRKQRQQKQQIRSFFPTKK